MKKIALCLMLLLTGCQSVKEVKQTDELAHAISISSSIEERVAHTGDEWTQLQETLNQLEKEDEWWYYTNDFYSRSTIQEGTMLADGMLWIDDIDTEQGKKAVEFIADKLGREFENFMSSENVLQVMETGGITEKVIGTYGVVLQKEKYSDYERTILYLCKSSLMLKDQKEQEWLEEICGEELILSAVSQGAENFLVEVGTPSFLMKRNMYSWQRNGTYYQIFKENNGDIKQVKMIIKQGAQTISKIPENQEVILNKLVHQVAGQEVEIAPLINDINSSLEDKSNGVKKGVVGNLNYRISKGEDTSDQSDVFRVEIDRSI